MPLMRKHACAEKKAWCPYRDAFAQLERFIADLAFVGGFLGCAGIALAARPHRRTQARHYPIGNRLVGLPQGENKIR